MIDRHLTRWSSSLRPQKARPARDSLRVASAAPYHGVMHIDRHRTSMKEKFHIPAVAAIIEHEINGQKCILIQDRVKPNAPAENGLVEIPAGKIREFENLFDTLRREVFEETGLHVSEITEEKSSRVDENVDYMVVSSTPFFVSQNVIGQYPILVITFRCRAVGEIKEKTLESENARWIPLEELKSMLDVHPEMFYAMHVGSLNHYVNIYPL